MPDTIIALATPPGVSALAILRLSGSQSRSATDQLLRQPIAWLPRHAFYRRLYEGEELLDDVVLTSWIAPHSFTGEEIVEITCHGNPLVVQHLLQAYLRRGLRVARPGEFTERAYLNGKMDLTQAEAVLDVIHASTPASLRGARALQEGRLGQAMHEARTRLIDLLAHLEAYIDFPDEDIQPETGAHFLASIQALQTQVQQLLASAPLGRILREGVSTVIIGAPNVGKSSLFNALLRCDRAIVSPIAGTTRDLIETEGQIGGFHLRLIDTAGQRETNDVIEAEGVRRAQTATIEADLILHLVEASLPLADQPAPILGEEAADKAILIAHKSDLGIHPDQAHRIAVSSLTGEGLTELESAIQAKLSHGVNLESAGWLTINARQEAALQLVQAKLEEAAAAMRLPLPPELVSSHLRLALDAIGEVVGVATNEDILDALFKKFCIGK